MTNSKSYAGHGKLLAKEGGLPDYLITKGWSFNAHSVDITIEMMMKYECDIKSCSELVENSPAFNRFKVFRKEFYQWRNAKQQEEAYTR